MLIGRARGLLALEQGVRDSVSTGFPETLTVSLNRDFGRVLADRLCGMDSPTLRYETILDTLMEFSDATEGYAFVYTDGGSELIAPESGSAPPSEVEAMLRVQVSRDSVSTQTGSWQMISIGESPRFAFVLRQSRGDEAWLESALPRLSEVILETASAKGHRPGAANSAGHAKRAG